MTNQPREFNWVGAEEWPTITLDEALSDLEAWPDPDGIWIWEPDEKGTDDGD